MIRPSLLALAGTLLFTGSLAQAQTVTVSLGATKYESLSRADCTVDPQETSNFNISWTSAIAVTNSEEMVFVSRTSSCSDSTTGTPPEALILRNRGTRTNTTGRFPAENSNEVLTARKLFDFASTDCGGTDGIETTLYLCVRVFPSSSLSTTGTVTSVHGAVPIKLDSMPPATPTDATTEALDSSLKVSWSMPTDVKGAARYVVHVKGPDGKETDTAVGGTATRSTTVSGLDNGSAYTVTVSAFDDAGTATANNNESPRSAEATGTPEAVQDFYERYRDGGGTETGGCSSAAASIGLLSLAGLLLRRRRGRAALALAWAAVPALASAQESQPVLIHSPRHYQFSLRTGAYTPNVDEEPGLVANGVTPYKDIFGADTNLLWRAQVDVDFFTAFGRASLGVSGGYWQASGKGRYAADPTAVSAQDVSLDLVPITPWLTYRADFLWERMGVPILPYARIGYGFAYWESKKGGDTSKFGSDTGSGWARGLEWSAGVSLVLDALEPDKAAALDQDFGINSTSVFVAYDGMQWEGANGLRLHGGGLNGGLAFGF